MKNETNSHGDSDFPHSSYKPADFTAATLRAIIKYPLQKVAIYDDYPPESGSEGSLPLISSDFPRQIFC